MMLYAVLVASPCSFALFVLGWLLGAQAYFDDVHDVAGPASAVFTLASLFAACGALLGGAIGLAIGAHAASRASGGAKPTIRSG